MTGSADAVGGTETNSVIAPRRAEFLAGALRDGGWTGTIITRSNPPNEGDAAVMDLDQRRATVELQVTAAPASQ